ncbi:MAG TPA: hypothetical protein VFW44_19950 [Bryobacteraceae bacterium]|nr:hypothetical protein [Bryobacteraceae bacterium]
MRAIWIGLVLSLCTWAQGPRTADGKPDFNGSWNLPYTPNMAKEIGELPFTEAGKAVYSKVNTAYDPTGFCLFPGVPRINNSPFPMRIVQTADSIVFLYEYMTTYRAVPLGKREHSKRLDPTFMGESIAWWDKDGDKDVLVVDTVGLNERTWLDTAGHPHSDALHVTERYQFTDSNHIAYEVTVDDPKMYTRPWTNHRELDRLKPGDHLMEYSCEENNKDRDEGHLGRGPTVVPFNPR